MVDRRAWTILKKDGREYYTSVRSTPDRFGNKENARSRKVSDWGYVRHNGMDIWGFETKKKAQAAAAKDKERYERENMTEATKNEYAKDLRTPKYRKRVVKDKTMYTRKDKHKKAVNEVSKGAKAAKELPPHLAKLVDKDGNPKNKNARPSARDVTPKGYGPVDEVSSDLASRYYKKSVKDLRNRVAKRKESGEDMDKAGTKRDDDRKIMNRVFGQRDAKKRMSEALDVKTLSVEQIAAKHDVSVGEITKQLNMGIKIEMEHTSSREEAAEIARDHLKERPDYYSKLTKMEKEPVNELSRQALHNYASKAEKDLTKAGKEMRGGSRKQMWSARDRYDKRHSGLEKAYKKLREKPVSEETVNELSTDTLKSYVKKADSKLRTYRGHKIKQATARHGETTATGPRIKNKDSAEVDKENQMRKKEWGVRKARAKIQHRKDLVKAKDDYHRRAGGDFKRSDGTYSSSEKERKAANRTPQERAAHRAKVAKYEKKVNEDAPVNATGAAVPGTGDTGDVWKKGPMVRRKKFAGQECFVVDSATYSQCIQGKKKFAHYKSYVGECETGQAIRDYGRANPGAPIIVMDEKTGAMSYLRYGGKWPK